MWAYYAKHPEEARIFDAAMSGQSSVSNFGVMAAYDFSGFGRVANIGGGQGKMLQAILEAAPNAAGMLFDLPAVVADAPAHPRMTSLGGSFLSDPLPTGCDCYILKFVLHDWPDEKARGILAAVRNAAPAGATLLVIESVRSEAPDFHPSKLMNVSMLALFGGRERTPQEFAALFDETGFALKRVIPTPLPMATIIEAEAI